METILFRLVSSGAATGMPPRREDGVVRPLLCLWREETEAYCGEVGLSFRLDTSNSATKRGLIREEILPLLRRLHPAADRNILAAVEERRALPRPLERAFAELVASTEGSKRVELGGGRVAVREYDRVWVERAPTRLDRPIDWGGWRIEPRITGLVVRGWRAGRPTRRAPAIEEGARSLRRCEDPPFGARGLAARGPGRRGGRGAGPGGGPGIRGRSHRAEGGTVRRAGELNAAVEDVLIDEEALARRVAELGAEITADYRGRDLLLVGVLKGAVFFIADLMRTIDVPCEVDFMAISSYGSATDSSGVVRILKDLDLSIEGRNVLVVEDIVDSGLTLSYLVRTLRARQPASLEVCALLTKPARRRTDVECRYVGFEIPQRFVIGYGLDFAERYRNLPYVGVLRDEIAAQAEESF